MRRVYIERCVFCPRSMLAGQRLKNYFIQNGWGITSSPRRADLSVVESCALTDDMEMMTLNRISKIKSSCPDVIVVGCLPGVSPGKVPKGCRVLGFRSLGTMDKIIGADVVLDEIPDPSVINPIFRGELGAIRMLSLKRSTRNTSLRDALSWIKPGVAGQKGMFMSYMGPYRVECSKGCLSTCSYCALRKNYPPFRSRSVSDILQDFRNGLSEGYTNFCLQGADTGAYGRDIGSSISGLLESVFSIDRRIMLDIENLNPRWAVMQSESLVGVLERNQENLGWVNIPVQSGSDSVLKAMRRGHTRNQLLEFLGTLVKHVPSIRLRTFIIVGFPGETEQDYVQTLEIVRKIGFEHVIVNKYSDRPGTESSRLSGKVPERVKERRMREVTELSASVKKRPRSLQLCANNKRQAPCKCTQPPVPR